MPDNGRHMPLTFCGMSPMSTSRRGAKLSVAVGHDLQQLCVTLLLNDDALRLISKVQLIVHLILLRCRLVSPRHDCNRRRPTAGKVVELNFIMVPVHTHCI